jgi:hypothetical protein
MHGVRYGRLLKCEIEEVSGMVLKHRFRCVFILQSCLSA